MPVRLSDTKRVGLALILLLGFVFPIPAQNSRPRYSSQPSGQGWVVPADTVIAVEINGTLTSRTARVGDKFTATVTVPVYVDGAKVIPAGAVIEGRVTQVTPARRMNKSGSIAIDFDDLILPSGARVRLVGTLTSNDARHSIDDEGGIFGDEGSKRAVFIGGAGAVGAVLGGIAGGAKGAAIGGIVGAGAGVASVLLSKGEEAVVPSGTPFGVQLKQPLIIDDRMVPQSGGGADNYPAQSSADPNPGPNTGDAVPPRANRPIGDPSTGDPRLPDRQDSEAAADPPLEAPADDPGSPAERIESSPDAGEPDLPLSSPEMIRRAQISLKEQGYYEGATDGTLSPRTSTALKTYQRENKLPETGQLDEKTATSLGLYRGASRSGSRDVERPTDRSPASRPAPSGGSSAGSSSSVVRANVTSASATRTPNGAIRVVINTQANTGGWRWFGDKVVNGDTLEVYARAVKPTGMVTQALTRGRIEIEASDNVENVRRVVVHASDGDREILLDEPTASVPVAADEPPARAPERVEPVRAIDYSSGGSLQNQADELLAYYQRLSGIRLTGSGVEIDSRSRYGESEVELLFAIDAFANAVQLYSRLVSSLRENNLLREATLDLARQARQTDRVISTSNSRIAGSINAKWDPIRQDVLKLMRNYNLQASDLDNE